MASCFEITHLRLADQGNYIVRGIRSRIGNGGRGNVGTPNNDDTDALQIEGSVGEHIIIDHCSFSWGTDGSLDIVSKQKGSKNITIQNCIIAETLEPHSLQLLVMGWKEFGVGPTKVSIIKNLFCKGRGRNPQFGNLTTGEICNNVIYNWGGSATRLADGVIANVISNYYKTGPSSLNSKEIKITNDFDDGPTELFVYGNIGPSRPSSELEDNRVVYLAGGTVNIYPQSVIKSNEETFLTAIEAKDYVLKNAGAFPRDGVDKRVVGEFYANLGKLIHDEDEAGGWQNIQGGKYPKDTDNDGIPDYWEVDKKLDVHRSDANEDNDGDGYTNIENYLNSLIIEY